MNASFNCFDPVVETNIEILCEAKAYELVSLSLRDFAEPQGVMYRYVFIFIMCFIIQYFIIRAY